MRKALCVTLVLAFASAASASLLGPSWDKYEAGWGGATFSNESASSMTIDSGGGSNVAYQVINVPIGTEVTLSGTLRGQGSSHWIEVLLFDYTGQNLAGGDGIDAPAPDPNIILKTDGFGGNPGALPGPTPFDTGLWGYWNNPGGSLSLTTATGQVVVGLKAGASGGSVSATFTDVQLVPEPATALLLGLPLLLIRRRR